MGLKSVTERPFCKGTDIWSPLTTHWEAKTTRGQPCQISSPHNSCASLRVWWLSFLMAKVVSLSLDFSHFDFPLISYSSLRFSLSLLHNVTSRGNDYMGSWPLSTIHHSPPTRRRRKLGDNLAKSPLLTPWLVCGAGVGVSACGSPSLVARVVRTFHISIFFSISISFFQFFLFFLSFPSLCETKQWMSVILSFSISSIVLICFRNVIGIFLFIYDSFFLLSFRSSLLQFTVIFLRQ